MSETVLIRWLRNRIRPGPTIRLGPGDDAAVLAPARRSRIVVTTDAFLEGTHFPPRADPARVGHKVIAASTSDIAAMGCYPRASFVTLALNSSSRNDFVLALAEAIIAAAEKYGAPVAGGDVTSWTAPLAITVTVVGETRGLKPVLRSGARPADRIFVTGRLGGSLLGRHLDATPRIREGLFLNRRIRVHAMIDLSDGLSTDLNHVTEESGVGALIRESAIPVSPAARQLADRDGIPALRHALDDGEDFELLFAVPPGRAALLLKTWPFDTPLTEIGVITRKGVLLERADGSREPLQPHGYEHRWSRP